MDWYYKVLEQHLRCCCWAGYISSEHGLAFTLIGARILSRNDKVALTVRAVIRLRVKRQCPVVYYPYT